MTGSMVMAVCVAVVAVGEPEVVSDAGYEADRAAAVEQGKLHIVYATRSNCEWCDLMESHRWTAPTIVTWLEAHAIVTPLDIDQNAAHVEAFDILGVPTTIAFSGDEEVGRLFGPQWDKGVSLWLDAMHTGVELPADLQQGMTEHVPLEPLTDRIVARAAQRDRLWHDDNLPPISYDEHSGPLLDALRERAASDESFTETDRLLWLMRNGGSISFRSLGLASFAAGDYAEGVREGTLSADDARHLRNALGPVVRDIGTEIRDPLRPMVIVAREEIETWLWLNTILGEYAHTADWAIDLIATEPAVFDRMPIEHLLSTAAQVAERWDLFTALHPDPVAEVEDIVGLPLAGAFFGQMQGEEIPDEQLAAMIDRAMWSLGDPILAAMMREDDGETMNAVVAKLEELCGPATGWRAVVVLHARQHGTLTHEWWSWIDEFDLIEKHPDLGEALQAALDNPPSG